MTLNTTVTWRGKPYRVTGYCTVGNQLLLLWLEGVEGALKGKQLREVKA